MFAQLVMFGAAALHLYFAYNEMYPWELPAVIEGVLKGETSQFKESKFKDLTVTIVKNAGIYNVIIAAGFLWAAFPSLVGPGLDASATNSVRTFFCLGAILAGVFGGLTLGKKAFMQAAVGVLGMIAVML